MSFRERKGDHNVKKSFALIFLLVLSVGLASAGLFGFLGDLFNSNGADVQPGDVNIKQYDADTRTLTVQNPLDLTDTIATVQLTTPTTNFVLPGKDRLVAEFDIQGSRAYTDALKKIEFYDLQNDGRQFEKSFSFKTRVQTGTQEVPEFASCIATRPYATNESVRVAVRTFDTPTYRPQSPLNINLTVMFKEGDCGAAVEERVPLGWHVLNIKGEGNGVLGPDNAIRWAPVDNVLCGGDSNSYLLSYTAVPDNDQLGVIPFTGIFSVDGEDQAIEGGRQIADKPDVDGTGNQIVGVDEDSTCNVRNQTIPIYSWVDIADVKPDLQSNTYHIGVFTDVDEGEFIEWVPTFYDVRITEWAIFAGYNNTQNKLFFFKFNQGNGTTVIDSMNIKNGTYDTAPVWELSNWTGYGNASRHPGALRSLDANISFNTSLEKNFTIEMRLTPTDVTAAGFLRIGTAANGFAYSFDGEGELSQALFPCGQVNDVGPTHVAFKKFTLVITRSDNVWKTYEDGVLVHTRTCDSDTFAGQTLYFGQDPAGQFAGFYDGQVDQMILWDRPLTATEILIENASTSDSAIGSITTTVTRLIAPPNNTLATIFTANFTNFSASVEPGLNLNITNATINVWYMNGSLFNATTKTLTGSGLNISTWNIPGLLFNTTYLWNVLGCSANTTAQSCTWADSNYTISLGNLPDAGFFNATAVSCSLQPSETPCAESPFPLYNIADANWATRYDYDIFDISGQDSATTVANYTIPVALRSGIINVTTHFEGTTVLSTINISLACFNRTNNNKISINSSNIYTTDYNVNITGSIPAQCLDSSYNFSLLTITVAPLVSTETISIFDSYFTNTSAISADTTPPDVVIRYPTNITYNANVTFLNYTVGSDATQCWWTTTNGVTNVSVTCGQNVTGMNSSAGTNTWRVYANDSSNNLNVSQVTFGVNITVPKSFLNGLINGTSTLLNVTLENRFSHLTINDPTVRLFMPFDVNQSLKTFDYSNFSNDGFINGTVWNATELIGGAYMYNGTSFISIPFSQSLNNTKEVSISAWVYANDFAANSPIIGAWDGANGWVIKRMGGDLIRYQTEDSTGSSVTATSNGALSTKAWHFIVATFNGTAINLYIDNTLNASSQVTNTPLFSRNFDVYIGHYNSGAAGTYWNGSIENVMILNRSMNSSEINQTYNFQRSRFFSRGEQIFNNLNISAVGNENTVNITIGQCQTLNATRFNVSIGIPSGSGYAYIPETVLTNCNANNIRANATLGNFSLKLAFYSNSFNYYSPVALENFSAAGFFSDQINPNATLLSPANNSLSTSLTLNLTANVQDDLSLKNTTIYLYNSSDGLVNRTTQLISGTFAFVSNAITVAVTGVYHWFYEVFDLNGNIYTSENRTITVDPNGYPQIVITLPQNTSYNQAQQPINYSVKAALQLSSCWYSTNLGVTNISVACGTNVTGVNASQGSNVWRVYANDTSNNLNVTQVTFFVDSIAPSIAITYPTNITYPSNVTTLNYTVSGSPTSCWYSTNLGVTNNSLTCGNNATGLNSSVGTNIWQVYANDSLNNVNSSQVTFFVDLIPPSISIVFPTNTTYSVNITTLNYTVDSTASSCWYSTNSGVLNTTVICGNNVSGLNSSIGSNTWRVYANDSLNNINFSSVTFNVVNFSDIIKPNITSVIPANNSVFTLFSVRFNVSAFDDVALSSYFFSINNGPNITFDGEENYTQVVGSYNVVFCVNDTSNNIACRPTMYQVANAPPTTESGGSGQQILAVPESSVVGQENITLESVVIKTDQEWLPETKYYITVETQDKNGTRIDVDSLSISIQNDTQHSESKVIKKATGTYQKWFVIENDTQRDIQFDIIAKQGPKTVSRAVIVKVVSSTEFDNFLASTQNKFSIVATSFFIWLREFWPYVLGLLLAGMAITLLFHFTVKK